MDTPSSKTSVSKRQFLGLAAAASALSISPGLLASAPHANHKTAYSKTLVAAAQECVSVGQACKSHIYQSLKTKDLSLTDCLLQVRDTIATCDALIEVVTNGSAHSKAMAKVCADVCKDCMDECNKHAKAHPICKTMAQSCDATIKACKSYSA
ncbi:MAG: hypothetical protein KBT88_00665 [Gammaproteobacteria bacterium]|nr:hypothetical protein [Gammaproteobacteria bacterium]MBQ0838265.1 hypothetical protein [Gammaproteobacteria bacterium]